MEKIEVNKDVLLSKLKENRETHIKDVQELQVAYNDSLIKEISALLKEAKKRPKRLNTRICSVAPDSYVKDYDETIGMLEISNNTVFNLDIREYRRYINNEWDWTNSFEISKTSYGL